MSIKTFVVDEHHNVLKSKIFQQKQLCLLNFDSHPDMGVPTVDKHDIGTWIVPKIYDHTISRVVFCYFFSHTSDGEFELGLGRSKDTQQLCIIDLNNVLPLWWKVYWGICEDNDCKNIVHFTFCVTHISNFNKKMITYPFVLSVDLDFFDVVNPFFSEVKQLSGRLQYVFSLLTCVTLEKSEVLHSKSPMAVLKDLAETSPSCESCKYKFEGKIPKLKTLNIGNSLFSLLLQGACQPHHPTTEAYRKSMIYPIFKSLLSTLHQPLEILVAQSKSYRSSSEDGLLSDVLNMFSHW